MSITVGELASKTERVFAFLSNVGFQLTNRECLSPDSFKGGFVLTYVAANRHVRIQYLDMQLEVSEQNKEVFGPTNHPEFSGNTFSREHLAEHIGHIAKVVERALSAGGFNAV